MKRVLVVGAGSYIGRSFVSFSQKRSNYVIDTVSTSNGEWMLWNFSGYDSILLTAGIAHRRETSKNWQIFYEVNCDLAINVAKKAKDSNVKQLVFLSSMSVYGIDTGVVTIDTEPFPKSHYGKSKLYAEKKLREIEDLDFKICIVRSPMVYGKDCPGNFKSLVNLVKSCPVFPIVNNMRSMIYIDNISSFIMLLIDREVSGLFLPQNKTYMSTTEMANWIAMGLGKRLLFSHTLGFIVRLLLPFVGSVRKGFGNLIYEGTDEFGFSYCLVDGKETVLKSIMEAE